MTKKEAAKLMYCIEDERFDYAIKWKSSWKEIKDEKFHKLRAEYLEALDKLAGYIEENE